MMSDSQLDRLFVIDPANFPTEAERNAIVAERWANPDAESPTLAARTNYATERRVDVDFSDTEYNDTTVVNNGTGAATFTIGGGLAWSAVRSVAERATPMKPAENWYYFDPTHEATATDDLGGVAGSAICEIIYADIDKLMPATDYLARIFQGAGDYFALIATAGTTIYAQQAHGGTTINTYLKNAGYRSVSLDGVHVLHMYVSTADGVQRIMVDGQSHFWGATVGSLDMSGNVTPKFGDSSMHDGILAMRLWNTAGAMTNVVASLQARVPNPWEVPTTLAGATLIGNWEMKMDAVQPASSTVLVNRANPGTCDLTISAGTFSSTTRLAVRGQS